MNDYFFSLWFAVYPAAQDGYDPINDHYQQERDNLADEENQ